MRQVACLALVAAFTIAPALLAQTEPVYRGGNGVTLPVPTREVRPNYTKEAMDQRIEGTVLLDCTVRPDGRVADIEVTQSLDSVFGLDRQAIEALRQWEFEPGTRDRKPVAVRISVQLTFTLK